MKPLKEMTPDELSATKLMISMEMEQLRIDKLNAPEGEKAAIDEQLKAKRQLKLDIQAQQDKHMKPLPKDAVTLKPTGIASQATVSAIGEEKKPAKKPRKRSTKK